MKDYAFSDTFVYRSSGPRGYYTVYSHTLLLLRGARDWKKLEYYAVFKKDGL